jgi:beta-galactosidase
MNVSFKSLALALSGLLLLLASRASAQAVYAPPASPRVKYNFNSDWKFIRQDVAGAEGASFDDSQWQTVSTPHSFNDVDSFREIISHSGGDRGTYKGLSWYRKTFKLPAEAAGQKVFIEFEGMRQAGDIYLNGAEVGLYENGVTGYGIDISNAVRFGDQANVLAVKVDNRTNYQERATHTGFEWNANDFNPDHGGINRPVWLYVTGKIYQTLPLFYGLQTTGTYIYGENYNIAGKTCDVTVESQVKNESGDRATAAVSVAIVDEDGVVRAQFAGEGVDMVAGEKTEVSASGSLTGARFWSPSDPYLYDVYSIVSVDGKVVDVVKTTTGFRKTEFKGGAGTGGVYINDKFVYLKGYSQRSSDEWAGIGAGYPQWMHDYTAEMLRESNGNYMRWMHVSPTKVDVEAYDRHGIVMVCPAGDKEREVTGVQWDQRVAVMRDSMVYFRNSPGILFWEAGNTIVTPEEMLQMVALRKELDPKGGRVMGTRDNDDAAANSALTPVSEYYGVMIGQDTRTDQLRGATDIFRGYSAQRRDKAPLIETEDFRDEGARRFWDDFSPPYFGFKKGPNDTYNYNSETFALAQVRRYWAYVSNMISNTDPAHSKWSGYASIYFIDSDADGRQDSSEVARVSGKIDSVRLPKEIYFAERVMQNEQPDIHIIGHWTYPANTTKTMSVIANNVDSVELFVNGVSLGQNTRPTDGYIYAFPNVKFAPGSIKAVGYKGGQPVATHELTTAGAPAAIKLTAHTSPDGLHADGEDAAFIDFEVVDAKGQRCPTDDARVDFKITGPGIWRGGYNSGKTNSTNNLYLNDECGINRVSVRSTLGAGAITITASRDGLQSGSVTIDAKAVPIQNGLTLWMPPVTGPAAK